LPELRLVQADPGMGRDYQREVEAKWEPQWRELGVRVRQEWVGFEEFQAEIEVGPSMWHWGWVSDYPDPDGMLGTFIQHTATVRDPGLSSLLELARTLRSRDERLALYREVDRRLVGESVRVVPTIYDSWHVVHRANVEGMWAHPMGVGPLDEVVVRRP
jgi:ABC-type transport system substrate-binding protein